MRILLIDDHPLFRQALAMTVIHVRSDIRVEQFETLAETRRALAANPEAALILLDLKLPDSDGIAGLLSLKALYPAIPIAIVSANDDQETIQTAIACGAAGFISKAAGLPELTAAVEALIQGENWFSDTSVEDKRAALTSTQTKILDGVHRGLMNKQIAYELGLTEATVKYHLTGLFRKLGVQTRSQLLALARDRSPSS